MREEADSVSSFGRASIRIASNFRSYILGSTFTKVLEKYCEIPEPGRSGLIRVIIQTLVFPLFPHLISRIIKQRQKLLQSRQTMPKNELEESWFFEIESKRKSTEILLLMNLEESSEDEFVNPEQ